MEPDAINQSRVLIVETKAAIRKLIAHLAANDANANTLIPATSLLSLLEQCEANLNTPTPHQQMVQLEDLIKPAKIK
jgi:hypothetical protein